MTAMSMPPVAAGANRSLGQEIPVEDEQQSSLETSRAWLEIDLECLRHNLQVVLERLGPDTELWAVVKANGYGHGAALIAREALACGAAGVCVATLMEGIELRVAGIWAPILVLGPLQTRAEIQAALQWNVDITLTCAEQIPLLQTLAQQRSGPIPVHLNVDTGMTRLGVNWQQAASIWQILTESADFEPRSLYSHLATADQVNLEILQLQHHRFTQVLEEIQARQLPLPTLHLDNSAGIWSHPAGHYQQVRAGLVLYGLSPAPHLALTDLAPVLSLKARITHLQTVPPQTGVSYGYSHITAQTTRVATVGIGYADGVPHRLSNWLQGRVRGQPIQQIGTITMDQCMWDVTSVSEVQIGDEVELIGSDLTVQAWAEQLGTIPYEILCGFSARLPRIGIRASP